MEEEVPVTRRDLGLLVIISLLGGVGIAAALLPVELSPQFLNAVMVGAMLVSFFMFIPVMGIRMFLEDRTDD
ncbi:hypothetical protein [Halopiger aswanensis]|uniref:Uncharacterized protein n=1 Tax=Halopiger aswanensis TaxID=148449 RepID=A0A3R7HK47_9EURY|nr:hypothetical protein [Halopiger aswanensis]RKD97480.1 hypothetical protein ATJ93_0466 [Halopiger aswanensis]